MEVYMTDKLVDVTLHINEDMDQHTRDQLCDDLLHIVGVNAADTNGAKPHLMIVEYNPDVVSPTVFVEYAKQRGLHMQLIGM
jgi:hypothetical protein